MTLKVRFAPSPTGKIHVGNVRAALINWLFAKKHSGKFVLRIDDTDQERSTIENERQIEEDLRWLGLEWDERYNQSKRSELYQKCADFLIENNLLYPCYDTPEELDRRRKVQLSRGLPPIYDRIALSLSTQDRLSFEANGRKPHWRFKLSSSRVQWPDLVRGICDIDTASLSDPVLIREDGAFLYTLPSVVDDLDMSINHVIRGEDHVANTAVQVEIFNALMPLFDGAKMPQFAHLSLLVGADGGPLSKRLGALSILQMKEEGFEPLAIVSHLAHLGTSDGVAIARDYEELISEVDFSKFGRAPARFDSNDLERLNADYLKNLSYTDVKHRLESIGCDLGEDFWITVRENITYFGDVEKWAKIIEGDYQAIVSDKEFLTTALHSLPEDYCSNGWKLWTDDLKAKTGLKGRALFMPLRLALTGLEHGPDMGKFTAIIGREQLSQRLARLI